MSTYNLSHFELHDQDNDEISQNDARYIATKDIVCRALRVIGSSDGRQALRTLAERIILERRKSGQTCLYPAADTRFLQLDHYIDVFLDRLRDEFMLVKLEERDAAAAYGGYNRTVRDKARLEDFRPSDAGNMVLDAGVIANLARAPNGPDRTMYIFLLTISVSHELAHCLTCYLNGARRPMTPPNVTVNGYESLEDDAGEAGFFWETQAFGGIVEMWSDPAREMDGINQPGIPYLFTDLDSSGREVSTTYIRDFVASTAGTTSAISLRIRPSSSHSPISQEQLAAQRSMPMDDLRNGEQLATPTNSGSASSSRPGTASGEYRDRRLRRRQHGSSVQGRSSHAAPGRTSRSGSSRSSSQDSYTKSAAAPKPPKRGATPPAPVSSHSRHGSSDVSSRSVPKTGEVRTSSSPARQAETATRALPARPKPAQKDAAPSADALKKQKKVAESTGQAGGSSTPKAPSSRDPRVKNVKR